jgi:hypothetical protein
MADLVWNSFVNEWVTSDQAAGLLNPPSGIPSYSSGTVTSATQSFTAPVKATTGTDWAGLAKGITSVFNSAFSTIYSFTAAGQAQAKATAATAAKAAATPTVAATTMQEYLLIAGVAVLGVVLALFIFKK